MKNYLEFIGMNCTLSRVYTNKQHMLISNNARQTDWVVTKLHFIKKNIAIGSEAAGYADSILAAHNDLVHV
jgi:hypothetical protein